MSTEAALTLIATLPRQQAEVIAPRVIAGLDVDQVAELLGKSPGAVRVAAHRGLRTLAVRLAPVDREGVNAMSWGSTVLLMSNVCLSNSPSAAVP